MQDQLHHILGSFESAISTLNSDVRRMGELAESSLDHAMRGLIERDTALCRKAIDGDKSVENLRRDIERESEELIMKFGPVARDLRRVIATLKVAAAIKSISGHALRLALRAQHINQQPPLSETTEIRPVSTLAAGMLEDANAAFCEGSLQAALMIKGRDARLDIEYGDFNERLMSRMQEDTERIPIYVDLLFCARSLERIGDQAVRISEEAVYVLTALDVRAHRELVPA